MGYILDRQEYLGHTVLGKSICEKFKTKQRRAATADELMIFPNTHEAHCGSGYPEHCPQAEAAETTQSSQRDLVEELQDQASIAQCEENECHFKIGFSAGLLVQQEAVEQMKEMGTTG